MRTQPKGKGKMKPLRELPRIHIPRTWVNKGMKKGRSSYAPTPHYQSNQTYLKGA